MTHSLDTQPAPNPVLKPVWTRPGEARKALLAALVAFAGPAIIAGTETIQHGWSYVALSLWLTAVVGGLAAVAGVFWLPNDLVGKKVLTDDVVRVLLDVAAHKPSGTVMQDTVTTVGDAEQISWKQRYVQRDITPPATPTPDPPASAPPFVVSYSQSSVPSAQIISVTPPPAPPVVSALPVAVSVTPSPTPRDPVDHSTDLPSATGSTAYTGPVPPVTPVVNVQPPEGHFLLPGTSL